MSEVRRGYKQTEVGVIPADWDTVRLTSIAKLESGHTPSRRFPEYWKGDVPWISLHDTDNLDVAEIQNTAQTIGTLGLEHSSARLLPKGTVVFSRTATVGKCTVMGREMATSQDFANYVCGPRVHNHYLRHLFGFMKPDWKRLLAGSTINTIYMPVFETLRVLLPSEVREQEAIAEALSDADALIESLEQLLTKKRQIKQGAMQDLLTGKKRLPGFQSKPGYKQTEVGPIPEDWDVRPLLKAVRIANGQVDPRSEPYRSMVLVAPDHVESGTGRLLAKETAEAQRAISGKYSFQAGDIVYSKIRPYLRKAVLANFDGLCSADMYPLKPAPDVSSGYIIAVILGHRFSKYAESVSVRSGMPKINRAEMAEFSLALPSLPEQTAIATALSDMDAEVATLGNKLTKVRHLKQGMMQDLLTGRTRLV